MTERSHPYPFSRQPQFTQLGQDCDARALRYEMKRLLRGNDLVRLPDRNSGFRRSVCDPIVDRRVDTSWKQNPFILGNILEFHLRLVSCRMRLGQNNAQWSFRERNDCEFAIDGRSGNQCHVKFIRQNTSNQFQRELCGKADFQFWEQWQPNRQQCRKPRQIRVGRMPD